MDNTWQEKCGFPMDSSASQQPSIQVCSMCKRWGGSCIKCRIKNCSTKFHPWCAHQKDLLQSEIEGYDGEKVGFYGRCVFHAISPSCQLKSALVGNKKHSLKGKDFACARAEVYKGGRQDGFQHNHCKSISKDGCLVSQEQLIAWIYINGQKFSSHALPGLIVCDIESDLRVVEYVGEIVGLRVADKREVAYQSGRNLQHKSACYVFRIDKENIIDATRKGGIARFVNHSCQPNCVAKVITVRHAKKVFFFAERDIFPGEEIT